MYIRIQIYSCNELRLIRTPICLSEYNPKLLERWHLPHPWNYTSKQEQTGSEYLGGALRCGSMLLGWMCLLFPFGKPPKELWHCSTESDGKCCHICWTPMSCGLDPDWAILFFGTWVRESISHFNLLCCIYIYIYACTMFCLVRHYVAYVRSCPL